MSRFWLKPAPITVEGGDCDCPGSFFWAGQTHPIIGCTNMWRLDVEWWRIRINRDYFKVRTTTHLLAVIYQDKETQTWYLQRTYG